MYHAIHVFLMCGFFVATSAAQELLPAARVKALKNAETAEISNSRTTQFKFSGPEGMQIGWPVGQAFAENQLHPPTRYNFPQGGTYHLQLRNIPRHEGLTVYLTINVVLQTEGTEVFHYLAHNSVPVKFTVEDIDHVASNNSVTKVFFWPNDARIEHGSPGVEFLDSTQVKPGIDVHVEAEKLGAAIAVVQLANREVQVSDPPLSVQHIPPTNTDTVQTNATRDAPSDQVTDSTVVRFFRLRFSRAPSTVILLKELIFDKSLRIVAEERTNTVVVTGTANQLLAVEALLLRLDAATAEKDSKFPDAGNEHQRGTTVDNNSVKEIQQQVAELRQEYQTANAQAHALAESLRETPDDTKKAKLRTDVQRAFTLRQSLLRAELVEMRTRLLQTQQSIDMREQIADQIVERRVEDLLNPQLNWEQTSNTDSSGQAESRRPKQPESRVVDNSGVVTELEGDWHLVAYITNQGTDRRPQNLTIRANQWNGTIWTGESRLWSAVVDANAKTIDFETLKVKNGMPNEIVSERGTYELNGDVLTIHSEYKCMDSETGALIGKGQHTNIWKRGLREIGNYDGRNPGDGMGLFFLNGSDENTGLGKLIPGDKVDVLVSFNSLDETPVQRVLVENLEVDQSSEGTEKSKRQVGLLGTEEQCSLLSNAPKHGIMSLRLREADDEVLEDPIVFNLESPGSINWEAFKELDASDPNTSELEGEWYQISATDENGIPLETRATNLYFRKRQYILAYPGGHTERRVEIDPNKKEIRYFENGDDSSMIPDNYRLEGDQLTIFNESRKNVYRRGSAPFPSVSRKQQRR